jgi:hypothetical protein
MLQHAAADVLCREERRRKAAAAAAAASTLPAAVDPLAALKAANPAYANIDATTAALLQRQQLLMQQQLLQQQAALQAQAVMSKAVKTQGTVSGFGLLGLLSSRAC